MIFYGYVNCAAYNHDPEGDTTWFQEEDDRDEALRDFRAWAISKGLSRSASIAGIYPVRKVVRGAEAVDEFMASHIDQD